MTLAYAASPVGRWVWGDLWKSTDKGFQGKPLIDKTGQPRVEWCIGLACPKGPEFDAFWAQVAAHAQAEFPQGQAQQPTFSWKLNDGDAPDKVTKPGHAGCWVLRLSSGFAPEVYDGNHLQIIDPQMVTKGDWLQVNIGLQGNGDVAKPGIYLNLGMTMLKAKGERISSGPSVAEVFGAPGAAIAAPAPPAQQAAPAAYQPAPAAAPQPAYQPPAAAAPAVAPGAPVGPQAAPAMPGAAAPAYVAPGPPGMPQQPAPPAQPAPAAPAIAALPGAAQPAPPAMPGQPAQPAPGFLTPGQPQQ